MPARGGVGMTRCELSRVGSAAAATWLKLAMLSVGSAPAGADGGHSVGDGQAVTLDGTFSPAEVGQLPELAGLFISRRTRLVEARPVAPRKTDHSSAPEGRG
ncbi:MAG: hypothetical protein ACRDWW_08905, partial [Acidimicrobiales bacterium]